MLNKKNTVSVVIPTYNSWSTLKDCIKSIQNQSLKPFEIIVIDNASADDTSRKVKTYFPKVKLATLGTNTGVTGGRNKGIKVSSPLSEFILFFDHDMVADKKMLEELVKVARVSKEIGITTPKIFYWEDRKRIWAAGTGINLWTGQVLFRGGKDLGQFDTAVEVQVAPAALLVKKDVIKKLKYFDNTYFATYEDTDFCFRAREFRFKTYYTPKAIAFHKISWSPKDDAERVLSRAYWVGRNRIIFMKRFGKNFFVFSIFVFGFTLYYLLLALKIKKFSKWLIFVKGTIEGYLGFKISEKYIPFTYINLIKSLIGNGVNTILDLGCGDGKLMGVLSVDENWEVTGVDIDKRSIEMAAAVPTYSKLIQGDLIKTLDVLIKAKEKFDVVLCSQVLEHLPKDQGEKILSQIDKVALKRVVVSTPNGFLEQIEESLLKNNPYQEHISGWHTIDFVKRNYTIKGVGSSLFWSHKGLARKENKIVATLSRLVAYILSPIIYYLPMFSVNLLAIKNMNGKQ